MAEPRMYKGRQIKDSVKIKIEIIDGKEVEILDIPTGCKNPYVDETPKEKPRKTVKPNPSKDAILEKMIETLREFSIDEKVYKTKEGKYAIETSEGKWFSMALTANKAMPKEKTVYGEEEGE